MKAIPTWYDGIRFRSKLEAQWAKLLDHYGIPWAYEAEGYEFKDGTKYLPDFWLPDSKQWLEVKGIMNDKDMHKCMTLAKESGHDVIIGYPNGRCTFIECDQEGKDLFFGDEDTQCRIDKCSECGKLFFHGEGSYYCRCCGAYDGDHYLAPPGPSYPECDWGEFAAIDVMAKPSQEPDDRHSEARADTQADIEDKFVSFLANLREQSPGLCGMLLNSSPKAIHYCRNCNTLQVVLPDSMEFTREVLTEPKAVGLIESLLKDAFGEPVSFKVYSESELIEGGYLMRGDDE